jgi:hypothetical protein
MTLSIMCLLATLSKMTLSIPVSSAKCRYAEYRIFIVMLSVIMLNVNVPRVIAPLQELIVPY